MRPIAVGRVHRLTTKGMAVKCIIAVVRTTGFRTAVGIGFARVVGLARYKLSKVQH